MSAIKFRNSYSNFYDTDSLVGDTKQLKFIAVHFPVCHALYYNKNKKICKNRCLVFLNDLVLFCSVILSL